jgi:RHS repeat-associated protein
MMRDGGTPTTYSYDNADQLWTERSAGALITYVYDSDGNHLLKRVSGSGTVTLSWDYENRLSNVLMPSGIRNTFQYNADNRRVLKIDSSGTTKSVWDEENILLETDGNDATQVVYTSKPATYGLLISQRRGSSTNYMQYEGLGSTVALTDINGVITDSYLYSAYGSIKVSSGNTITPFKFLGRFGYYYDADPVQYYVRERYYKAVPGSFLSVDSLFLLSDVHRYAYTTNNPTNGIDPAGTLTWTVGNIKRYGCGRFEWPVTFKPGVREQNGFIIQRVRVDIRDFHCNNKVRFRSVACPVGVAEDEGPSTRHEYYEIWEVKGGKVYGTGKAANPTPNPIDTFGYGIKKDATSGGGPGSKSGGGLPGYFVEGMVYFDFGTTKLPGFDGTLVPTAGWALWNESSDPAAGGLLTSCTRPPNGLADTGLGRYAGVIWNCCCAGGGEAEPEQFSSGVLM